MEGDAGAGRLNPNDAEDSASEVTAEDSAESEVGTDQTSTADVTADEPSTETNATDDSSESEGDDEAGAEDADEPDTGGGNQSRLGRGWLIGIAATLVVLAACVAVASYLFPRHFHQKSEATARNDALAAAAAKDCVAATQAPDTRAMAAAAQKMIDCGTGVYRSQAILYSSLLVEAYQAANAQVQVTELRAAVERNNDDGSVDVLVPIRVKVSNSAAPNQEAGYRLRVTMLFDEGKYRIANLVQVADPDKVAK